jgi:hypothetical protein
MIGDPLLNSILWPYYNQAILYGRQYEELRYLFRAQGFL